MLKFVNRITAVLVKGCLKNAFCFIILWNSSQKVIQLSPRRSIFLTSRLSMTPVIRPHQMANPLSHCLVFSRHPSSAEHRIIWKIPPPPAPNRHTPFAEGIIYMTESRNCSSDSKDHLPSKISICNPATRHLDTVVKDVLPVQWIRNIASKLYWITLRRHHQSREIKYPYPLPHNFTIWG